MNESVTDTQNPQETAPTSNASDVSDFQTTANDQVLTQESDQQLSVTNTGEPLEAAQTKPDNNLIGQLGWGVLIAAVVLLVAFVLKRLFEEDEDYVAPLAQPAANAKVSTSKKPANKKASAKKSTKKKQTTKGKSRKKSGKRR
jgi:replication initiation and membrane attachment protein DnaB